PVGTDCCIGCGVFGFEHKAIARIAAGAGGHNAVVAVRMAVAAVHVVDTVVAVGHMVVDHMAVAVDIHRILDYVTCRD
ncbi:hypothetical protein BX616_002367, partial [Lobosporangium transversale]